VDSDGVPRLGATDHLYRTEIIDNTVRHSEVATGRSHAGELPKMAPNEVCFQGCAVAVHHQTRYFCAGIEGLVVDVAKHALDGRALLTDRSGCPVVGRAWLLHPTQGSSTARGAGSSATTRPSAMQPVHPGGVDIQVFKPTY
jgi:hypothetical protein